MARASTTLLLLALLVALADFACAWNELHVNADAAPLREMTNAQRLAKGLPPKKPRYRRGGENRLKPSGFVTAASATSTAPAVVSTPTLVSTPACAEVTGTIKVAAADGSLAGFVSAPNEEGLYGYTADVSEAAKFKYSSCAPIPFDITGETTEAENTAFELLGGVQDSRTGCFLVGNVPQTTSLQNLPNPLASVLGLASSQVASSIWNVTDGSLLATLGDGSATTPTPITYNTGTGLFAFNADGKCPGTNATLTFASA